MIARVLSVNEESLGSALASSAAIGATYLHVQDASQFGESGTLEVDGEVLAYSAVESLSSLTYDATVAGLPGIVSEWKLDETSGTNADDWIGGFDGTYTGGVTLANVDGPLPAPSGITPAQAPFFDDTDDHVNVTDNAAHDVGTADFTVGCWFKRSTLLNLGVLVSKKNGTGATAGWYCGFNSTNSLFMILHDGTTSKTHSYAASRFIDDEWHLLITGRAGDATFMNVDGIPVGTPVTGVDSFNLDNAIALRVGTVGGATTFFDGNLARPFICNGYALTEAEALDLYARGKALLSLDAPNVIHTDATTFAHTAETSVAYLYPRTIDRTAILASSDDPHDEEGMAARIPHALWDRLPLGMRDIETGEAESVSAELQGNDLVVTDVLGKLPQQNASTMVGMGGMNLLINPSFEDPDTSKYSVGTPWYEGAGVGSIARKVTTIAVHGTAYMEITPTGDPAYVELIQGAGDGEFDIAVRPDTAYSASCYILGADSDTVARVSLKFLDSSFNSLGWHDGETQAINDTTWTRVVAPALEAPPDAAWAQFKITILRGVGLSNPVYVDACQVEEGSGVTAFIPFSNRDGIAGYDLIADMALVTEITAGDPDSAHMTMSGEGLVVVDADQETTFSLDSATGDVYTRGRIDFGSGSRLDSDIFDMQELPATGYQTPTLIQSAIRTFTTPSNGPFCAWGSATTPGNLCLAVITIQDDDGTAPTITPPAGWTLVDDETHNGQTVAVYRTSSTTASRSGTETFSLSDTTGWVVSLYEYAGVQVAAADRTIANNSSFSGTISTPPFASPTTQDANLLFAAVMVNEDVDFSSVTSGFAQVRDSYADSFNTFKVEHAVWTDSVTIADDYSFSVDIDPGSAWACILAAFKAKPAAIDPPAADKLRIYALDDGHPTDDASTLTLQNELGFEKNLEYPGLGKFHHTTAPPFFYAHSDFHETSLGATVSAPAAEGVTCNFSGTGALITAVNVTGHPGVAVLRAGTTTSGHAQIRGANNSFDVGAGRLRMGGYVQVPTLSDGTNRFYAGVGFKSFDGVWGTLATGNIIAFRYADHLNSAKWQAGCSDGSSSSTADTGITVNAGQWYWLEVDVAADGSEANFYVDGVLCATLNTNMPTGAVNHHAAGILKTLGTTSRDVYLDYYYAYAEMAARA